MIQLAFQNDIIKNRFMNHPLIVDQYRNSREMLMRFDDEYVSNNLHFENDFLLMESFEKSVFNTTIEAISGLGCNYLIANVNFDNDNYQVYSDQGNTNIIEGEIIQATGIFSGINDIIEIRKIIRKLIKNMFDFDIIYIEK